MLYTLYEGVFAHVNAYSKVARVLVPALLHAGDGTAVRQAKRYKNICCRNQVEPSQEPRQMLIFIAIFYDFGCTAGLLL